MKNLLIYCFLALFGWSDCLFASSHEIVLPHSKLDQLYTYRIVGVVMDVRTHVIIPEAIVSLKNLSTGQENTYSCDKSGSYVIVLDVRNSYQIKATAKEYTPSEQYTVKENSNNPEETPVKIKDFELLKRHN